MAELALGKEWELLIVHGGCPGAPKIRLVWPSLEVDSEALGP